MAKCVTCGSPKTDRRRFCKPDCFLAHPDGREKAPTGICMHARVIDGELHFVA